jgi:hypothetical protein
VYDQGQNLRFASLIAVICGTGLTRGHGGVVNELEEVLAESSNDGNLLAVLTEGIKVVGEGRL